MGCVSFPWSESYFPLDNKYLECWLLENTANTCVSYGDNKLGSPTRVLVVLSHCIASLLSKIVSKEEKNPT